MEGVTPDRIKKAVTKALHKKVQNRQLATIDKLHFIKNVRKVNLPFVRETYCIRRQPKLFLKESGDSASYFHTYS